MDARLEVWVWDDVIYKASRSDAERDGWYAQQLRLDRTHYNSREMTGRMPARRISED